MTGWRCGFVAGNELLVKAYSDVKDNTDSGAVPGHPARGGVLPRPSGDHGENRGEIFAAHGGACGGVARGGFNARKPKGSFFLYVAAPRAVTAKGGPRREFRNAEEGSQWFDHREADIDGAVG